MKLKIIYFMLLTVSTIVMAAGIYFFKFPNNFTFGGITGLAVLVAKTGLISASDFSFLANILLLILGLVVLGKDLPPRRHTVPFFYPSPYPHWSGLSPVSAAHR